MLPHENQMFLDVASSDGCLLIAAKGLGVHHVLANLIKVYSEPGNLVLILGSTEVEEDFLIANAEDDDDPELKVQKPRFESEPEPSLHHVLLAFSDESQPLTPQVIGKRFIKKEEFFSSPLESWWLTC